MDINNFVFLFFNPLETPEWQQLWTISVKYRVTETVQLNTDLFVTQVQTRDLFFFLIIISFINTSFEKFYTAVSILTNFDE